MKRFLLAISIFAVSIAFTGNLMSATANGSIYVWTEALVTCVMGSTAVNLGSYTGDSLEQFDSVSVQCSDTTPYTISYGEGENFLPGARRLSNGGTDFLDYYMNCESTSGGGFDIECGNGTTIGSESAGTGTGLPQPFAIHVVLPGGQFVPSGEFSDNVITTLTY